MMPGRKRALLRIGMSRYQFDIKKFFERTFRPINLVLRLTIHEQDGLKAITCFSMAGAIK